MPSILLRKLLTFVNPQIGESCDPQIRGILGSLPTIFMSLAILVAYVFGSLARWDTLAWYCSSMSRKSFYVFDCVLLHVICGIH